RVVDDDRSRLDRRRDFRPQLELPDVVAYADLVVVADAAGFSVANGDVRDRFAALQPQQFLTRPPDAVHAPAGVPTRHPQRVLAAGVYRFLVDEQLFAGVEEPLV